MPFKPDLLRKELKAAGKTQSFLAAAVGVRPRTVSRWLKGDNPPKDKDLKKIADVLGCTPQEFDPNFADVGQGDVPIHARVSNASHNAYEILRRRYGVSQRDIIEAGPVLFSIVAAHGLKIPDNDEALGEEIFRSGGTPWYSQGPDIQDGFFIDKAASKSRECYGRLPPPDTAAPTRNLFFEAVLRLSDNVRDTVNTKYLVSPDPGEAMSTAGFNPDVDLLNRITGGDEDLIKAVIYGKIRLSKCLEEHEKAKDETVDAFVAILRREMAQSDGKATEKLKSWRAFYKLRHPDLAREYDQIVEQYCHEDGWCPAGYGEDTKEHYRSNPYLEDRHLNKGLLPKYQERLAESRKRGVLELILPLDDPIRKRFEELAKHRAKVRAEFEEAYDE